MNSQANSSAALDAAQIAADANRYATDIGLQRQRENLAYEGEQQGLGRAFDIYRGALGQQYNQQNQYNQSQYNLQNLYNQAALGDYYGAQQWQRNQYGNALNNAFGTVLSNPDYFQDPQAA